MMASTKIDSKELKKLIETVSKGICISLKDNVFIKKSKVYPNYLEIYYKNFSPESKQEFIKIILGGVSYNNSDIEIFYRKEKSLDKLKESLIKANKDLEDLEFII